jgi:peptidyl-prolyl cis-trans isomerase D
MRDAGYARFHQSRSTDFDITTGLDMLQTIRDNSQGLIAKLVIGFIIAIMALFGVESIMSGFVTNPSVAEVNGEEITELELTTGVQNLLASVGGNLESLDEDLIRQVALNQIIEDRLLRQAAQDASLVISSDAIDLQIINNPQFQVGGVFNSDLAVRTMATQGFTVVSYRQALADQMVVGQIANAFASSGFVTQSELERIAALSSQTRDFRFVSVTLGNRTGGEPIPADQIESYYQNNQSRFIIEEEVAIDYVVLDKAAIFAEVQVGDEDVRARYDEERAVSSASTQRRASHILLEISASATEESVVAEAAALKARVDAGEDFGALALEASIDTVSAAQGGDIGFSDGTAFPAAVEQALASLEVGQISEPVVSEFGVHLVKLTEYDVNEFPSFEESEDRIRRELSSAEVDEIYFARLETLANLAFETTDLTEISQELFLTIQQSELFSRSGGFSEITTNANVIAAAFSDEVLVDGDNSEVIEMGSDRALVMHINTHNEESLRSLEEVRGEVAAILRTELEKERAAALGEQLLTALQSGQSIDQMLVDNELQWIVQTNAARDQAGLNSEVLRNVFALSAPAAGQSTFTGFALTNGTFIVAELQRVNRGSLEQMEASEREELVRAFVERDGRAAFDAFLANTRNNAEITENLTPAATF